MRPLRNRSRAAAGHARVVRGPVSRAGDARPSTGHGRLRSPAERNMPPEWSRTRNNLRFSARSACGCCGPDHPILSIELLKSLLSGPRISRCGTRRFAPWAWRSDDASRRRSSGNSLLTPAADTTTRAFALLGLAHSAAKSAETRRLLLAQLPNAGLRRDALRSLLHRHHAGRRGASRLVFVVGWPAGREREGFGRTTRTGRTDASGLGDDPEQGRRGATKDTG